ncbi:MAG: hypothetical protein JO051_08215 [Acidobacteriaceae bacterium]|nr:hypothetical protein [Acidobacteriaceae bacterium]
MAESEPGGYTEEELNTFHRRADHEDNLHVSRTYVFINLNLFIAVAVALTLPHFVRAIFALMAFFVDLSWTLWAWHARASIHALRNEAEARCDQRLLKEIKRKPFAVGPLAIMSTYMPWITTISWAVIFGYFLAVAVRTWASTLVCASK